MAVQDVVFSTPQLEAQGAEKFQVLVDWNGRTDYARSERSCLFVHRSRVPEYAIKGPIDFYFSLSRMPKHPYKPILHCAVPEAFYNMEDSQDDLKTRPVITSQVTAKDQRVNPAQNLIAST